MLKKILFALMFAIVATVTHAESDLKTAASKAYVDTMVETRQDKIPAANQQGVGAGETVMTYTAAGNGAIGERGIYTGANAYNANSDADKLITASALNDTFTNLPTTDTTKLECANQADGCTLWTIIDQTAYGISGDGTTTIDLSALVNVDGTGNCYKSLSAGTLNNMSGIACTTALANYGDWGAMFTYNNEPVQVSGISVCSSVNEGSSVGGIPTNQTGVQSDYESNMAAAPTSRPVGGNCYCKLTDPSTSAARWVLGTQLPVVSMCANTCAIMCGSNARSNSGFRGAVFGVN